MPYTSRKSVRGLTLIELMITVAIVSILARIALPTYASYLNKGRARAAAADLSTLALNLENKYQLSLAYPVYAASAPDSTNFPAWQSTQSAYFNYSVTSTATGYTVKATGISTGPLNGCTLTLDNSGTKTVGTGCPSVTW